MSARNQVNKQDLTRLAASAAPPTLAGLTEIFVGGGTGIALGTTAEIFVNWIFGHRLGRNEEARVSDLVEHATSKLSELHHLGYQLRSDAFFVGSDGYSSDFSEIIEAVIRAAVEDHEQRKAVLLGRLLANIAQGPNAPSIDRSDANLLISRVRTLSYRQLCMVSVIVSDRRNNEEDRFRIHYDQNGPTVPRTSMMAFDELRNLQTTGLVGMSRQDVTWLVTVKEPSNVLYDEADLDRIDTRDTETVRLNLQRLADSINSE